VKFILKSHISETHVISTRALMTTTPNGLIYLQVIC